MANYSRREITTTRVEFVVPAAEPYGACWVEVMKAIHAAIRELKDAGVVAEDSEPSDTQLMISPQDDDLIISYEREVSRKNNT